MDICGLIATRKDSKRVKNKSTRKFGSSNLSIIKINQALKIKKFKNIYFSSDIPELNKYASKKGLILIKRPKKYLGKCTISDLAPFLVKHIKENHICYLMNTSPLIKYKTLKKAVGIYEKLNFSKYDSLNTFEIVKDFLWGKNEVLVKFRSSTNNMGVLLFASLNFLTNGIARSEIVISFILGRQSIT